MSAKQQQPQYTWQVISQTETSRLDASGRVQTGVLVRFRTINGLEGSVFVPDSAYNPVMVRTLIEEKLQSMLAVQNLSGQVG
jgi:hypothetical protein